MFLHQGRHLQAPTVNGSLEFVKARSETKNHWLLGGRRSPLTAIGGRGNGSSTRREGDTACSRRPLASQFVE